MAVTAAVRAVREVENYNDGATRRGTVTAGTDIPKGTVLKLADPRTLSASTGTGDIYGGVSSMDKEGDDPSTSISTWQNGIYEFTASGSVTAGHKAKTAAPGQYVMEAVDADVTSSLSIIVGVFMKDQTDGNRVQVRTNN